MLSNFPEPLVARVIGLPKRRLVRIRRTELAKDSDWSLERNVVVYSDSGLKNLLGALGLSMRAFSWPDKVDAADMAAGDDEAQNGALDSGPDGVEKADGAEKIAVSSGQEIGDRIVAGVKRLASMPIVELTVLKVSHNPTLISASTSAGEHVMVRVANNSNFIPGMPVKARRSGLTNSLFNMVGHCPRWRGRY